LSKILISGFEIFGEHQENSSEIIAKSLEKILIPDHQLKIVILPVSFKTAFEMLRGHIDSFHPDYVISFGLAGERSKIGLEKVAINWCQCSIPDNEGRSLNNQKIIDSAPAAYFATLPLEEMVNAQDEFPLEISFTAGTYVCNYLMYSTLHHLNESSVKAGFVHLPHLVENKDDIFRAVGKRRKMLKEKRALLGPCLFYCG
jgi:pyroglutamyl-peptidase